jgi:DNA gyrase/topoisomerase IV subunit A
MSWQEKLQDAGIDESSMPNMVKKAVNDLKAFQKEADKITTLLERDDLNESKRQQLEDDYDTLVESIENQEEVIEKKIEQWNKNKDGYAARGEKLAAARLAKKQAKGGATSDATPTPQAQPQPPQPPQPPTSVEPIVVNAEEVKDEPKKSGGWGWLLLIGVVAIASLGAINLSKDE